LPRDGANWRVNRRGLLDARGAPRGDVD
jgi:hypothetical protein